MPKPLFGDNGSGMHTHMSLWKDGKPLFAGNGYAGLSEMALFFIGGILRHAPALTCITNPDDEQLQTPRPRIRSAGQSRLLRAQPFRRDPHPDLLRESESETDRVPHTRRRRRIRTSPSPRLLLAGLDGIQSRIDPGDPLDKNLYELPPEELANVPSVPDSLSGAIKASKRDHGFLLKGDVFNADFVANWIEMKQKEYDALRLRPHPYEFAMYYDV